MDTLNIKMKDVPRGRDLQRKSHYRRAGGIYFNVKRSEI